MKLTQKIVALTGIVAFAATPLFAGTGKTFKETVVVEEEATPWYNASLSTGFDSLYMFRGANLLNTGNGNNDPWGSYGDSLYWTSTSFTWNITENDSLSIGAWMAFGLGNIRGGYRELDIPINYTHTMGDLALGLGYTFYYIFPQDFKDQYANELNVSAAYTVDLGFMSLTPKITYFFNLGPDRDVDSLDLGAGSNGMATSYLDLRLTGNIPVYKEIVSLSPYTALGMNFGYNLEPSGSTNSGLQEFNGFNNWELGVSLPVAINDNITLTGYVAYSYAFVNLWGTTVPSTFWGGANIAFAF
ncbi:MAG: hypothetical protein KGR46_05560 [Verrucomicrobia bacterium]|nr:hypothetical protein [Verrucomicrobiota bacterium]